MSQEEGHVIEHPTPVQEAVAAINARWSRLRFRPKDGDANIYDEVVEFERGFYRLRISWLPKNGVIKFICRWPILMPAGNFAELALTIGRINFGVRVGKFEFDERDGELCLRHSFLLGEKWAELTTHEQRNTLYCNMFVLSHEMMESNWDVFARLSHVKTEDDDGEEAESGGKSAGNALFVADAAINEGEDLAEGTMGNVARAALRGSEEHCVVKHLRPRKNFTEEDQEIFKQEASAAHRLFHPNLVPIRAVCVNPPQIVEPFFEAGNLAKLLESNKTTRLPTSRVFKIMLDVARGVNYMHECGTTHGRLRPQNILLNDDGTALVSDYGLAKTRKVILDGNTGPGDSGALYAAPEVLFGKPTSAGTDVFSIGIMLFQFLMPDAELLPPVVPELIAFGDGIAPEVEKLVRDCLNRDASKRPAVLDIIPVLKQLADKSN